MKNVPISRVSIKSLSANDFLSASEINDKRSCINTNNNECSVNLNESINNENNENDMKCNLLHADHELDFKHTSPENSQPTNEEIPIQNNEFNQIDGSDTTKNKSNDDENGNEMVDGNDAEQDELLPQSQMLNEPSQVNDSQFNSVMTHANNSCDNNLSLETAKHLNLNKENNHIIDVCDVSQCQCQGYFTNKYFCCLATAADDGAKKLKNTSYLLNIPWFIIMISISQVSIVLLHYY